MLIDFLRPINTLFFFVGVQQTTEIDWPCRNTSFLRFLIEYRAKSLNGLLVWFRAFTLWTGRTYFCRMGISVARVRALILW